MEARVETKAYTRRAPRPNPSNTAPVEELTRRPPCPMRLAACGYGIGRFRDPFHGRHPLAAWVPKRAMPRWPCGHAWPRPNHGQRSCGHARRSAAFRLDMNGSGRGADGHGRQFVPACACRPSPLIWAYRGTQSLNPYFSSRCCRGG